MIRSMTVMDLPLDLNAIRARLDGHFGVDLRYFAEVDSTNREMREIPYAEWLNGLVVLTDFQSAGRGRAGRAWEAPSCTSLLMSVLVELPAGVRPSDAVMLAAVAAGDAITSVSGKTVQIKWPNDLLIDGRKVAGILGEHVTHGGRNWSILGIGINVNTKPEDLVAASASATSLAAEVGHSVSREDLGVGVLQSLELWYGCFTQEPDGVFAAWSARLGMIDSDIIVQDTSGDWRGKAVSVRRDGGLVVLHEDGKLRTVYAADVSVRRAGELTTT
jgi:BirA family transcriptional regulator, biotin operon repressor / biotin---[acetyl-CoA-carboxylase] ligase